MKIPYIKFEGLFKLPTRNRFGDSGYDCFASEEVVIPARGTAKVPLGFGMKLPIHKTAYMHNRSGTFLRGLSVANALIDPNYRGEIHAIMQNITDKDVIIERGERPCSLVLAPFEEIEWITEELDEEMKFMLEESRGTQAFNSSGK